VGIVGCLGLEGGTLVLTRHLKPHISNQCVHVKGNGGGKEAVRQITKQLKDNSFVFRSDVKSYYASIDHHVLMEQLHSHINDARVITLIWDYLNRTVQFGGLYRDIKRGISLGCPLSPLIGALYLKLMDDRIISEKISIRVNGIDTPEIRGKCEKEKYDAQQAKEMVADILKDAKVVT
jgi:RNA-directed DNA polymerase